MSNIYEVVAADRNLAAIGKGLQAAGLEFALQQQGPFTLFAPSDIAFGKLETGRWPELLRSENKIALATEMNNYVVRGKTELKDLSDGQKLVTLGGRELTVKVTGDEVEIDGARVQARDMQASNGVVHSIDSVFAFNN